MKVAFFGLATSVAALCIANPALAQTSAQTGTQADAELSSPHHFNLAAQSALKGIPAFARQAGIQIVAPAAHLDGVRTNAVHGDLPTHAALAQLLAGTGLSVAGRSGNTISLHLTAASAGEPVGASSADTQTDDDSARANQIVVIGQAIAVAPSTTPLDALQPTSNIDRSFIKNNITPLSSYDDVVKFAPSVWDQSPNGPGLGKSETLSLRGFQDGQFNVTYDGIPFGDSTDLHHTSSALFIAHDLLDASVDRGPGTASTIGNATFGGSMNFNTKAPLNTFTVNPYLTVGSFDTWSLGTEVDTGETKFGKAFIDVQHEESDGYLSYAQEQRTNIEAKTVSQLAPNIKLTLLASWNHSHEYTTQGTTLANIKEYGWNYALGNDPSLQNYYKYQPSNYSSDFEYARLEAGLGGGWSVDNTLYTTSFTHDYKESKDASDNNPADVGVTYYDDNGKKLSPQPANAATDITGKQTNAHYRAYGDTLRVSKDLGAIGKLNVGLWAEHTVDDRWSATTDVMTGDLVNTKYGTPYKYIYHDTANTLQPYAELVLTPASGLTLTPGVRFTYFQRKLDAALNSVSPPAPENFTESYHAWQPSIAANYKILKNWSVYAQVARGFLAPPLDTFQTQVIQRVSPERTTNYQVGTAAHIGNLVLGADAYYIDFNNYITSVNIDDPDYGVVSTYTNGGGAVYKGLEAEVQYVVGKGFSLYGNASLNSAKYKHTDVWIAESPRWTAAAGVLYDNRTGPYASIIAKWIGPRYGLDTDGTDANGEPVFANDPTTRLDTYMTTDLALGVHLDRLLDMKKETTISLKVSNLFNLHKIVDYAGTQSATDDPLYWVSAGRSAFLNISVSM
ncbi:TonB-dependent receptor domain-containing protein [Novosphingobium sp. 9]|uniref:TonB-dependent receptor domain-containing protein n=1 Tax=Novosphingobium sp. 9 TaxID=2025349 RepID=UPI0021B599BE|nr:TonB-dependent receptor [Novosphingobium sp. 9]